MKLTAVLLASCFGVLFLLCCHRQAPQVPADVFSFQLNLSNDSLLSFKTLRSSKATAFVFLAPDCPQSQSYSLTLNELHEKLRNGDIGFYGVIAGGSYHRKEIDGFMTQYRIGFPIVLDPDAALAQFLGATVTPEAFLVNSEGRTAYQGAIDNWVPELGQHRTVITEHYLPDALDSFIRTGKVAVNKTKAVGCFIERGS